MAASLSKIGKKVLGGPDPILSRTIQLSFQGDWGQANFHRILSWITQEVCDRAGSRSTTSIQSLPDGGSSAVEAVFYGHSDMCIATPAKIMKLMVEGRLSEDAIIMPCLRAIATLPQRDRMMLGVSPKYGVKCWADILHIKPALRIATSTNDGTNVVGYIAYRFLAAHGLSVETLQSWGGQIVTAHRPDQCADLVRSGQADCLLHEAIMGPWWREFIEGGTIIPINAEKPALEVLDTELGLGPSSVRAGFWSNIDYEVPALEFEDFVLVVRDDMPVDLAFLITWVTTNTRDYLEHLYSHVPSELSGVTYPLEPLKMAQTSIPLHSGAEKFYKSAGLL